MPALSHVYLCWTLTDVNKPLPVLKSFSLLLFNGLQIKLLLPPPLYPLIQNDLPSRLARRARASIPQVSDPVHSA